MGIISRFFTIKKKPARREEAPEPESGSIQNNSVKSPKKERRMSFAKKQGTDVPKDVETFLVHSMEAPLAAIVKTVSTELVKPFSKAVSSAWNQDKEDFFGSLASLLVDPRDILSTINIGDITESVSITLMALVKKLVDDYIVPFLEALCVILQAHLGGRYLVFVAWIESFVRAVVPSLLGTLFGNAENSRTSQWVSAITEDILKAIHGRPGKRPVLGSSKDPSPVRHLFRSHLKQSAGPGAKLAPPPEESLADSLMETLRDFKVHVEEALK